MDVKLVKEYWPILRDVAIIYGLTFAGGYVAGFAYGMAGGNTSNAEGQAIFVLVLAVSNLLFGTIGFAISGWLAPPERWRHLSKVGVGLWLTGLINIAVFNVTVIAWIWSAIFIAIAVGLGGGISYLFKRAGQPS